MIYKTQYIIYNTLCFSCIIICKWCPWNSGVWVWMGFVPYLYTYIYNKIAYKHIFIHIYDRYTMMYSVYTADTRMCNCVSLPPCTLKHLRKEVTRVLDMLSIHTCLPCTGYRFDPNLDWNLKFYPPAQYAPAHDPSAISWAVANSVSKTSKVEAQLVEMSSNWAYWSGEQATTHSNPGWKLLHHVTCRVAKANKLGNCACKPNYNAVDGHVVWFLYPHGCRSNARLSQAVVGVQLSHDGNLVLSQAQVGGPRSNGRHLRMWVAMCWMRLHLLQIEFLGVDNSKDQNVFHRSQSNNQFESE